MGQSVIKPTTDASEIVSGVFAPARLASGSPTAGRVPVADGSGSQLWADPPAGPPGPPGPQGPQGNPGVGVPAGGATGHVLRKASAADYDTEWAAPSGGGGSPGGVEGSVQVKAGGSFAGYDSFRFVPSLHTIVLGDDASSVAIEGAIGLSENESPISAPTNGRNLVLRGGRGGDAETVIVGGNGGTVRIEGGIGGVVGAGGFQNGDSGNVEIFGGPAQTDDSHEQDPGAAGEVRLGFGATETLRVRNTGAVRFVPRATLPQGTTLPGDVFFSSAASDNTLVVHSGVFWAKVATEQRTNIYAAPQRFTAAFTTGNPTAFFQAPTGQKTQVWIRNGGGEGGLVPADAPLQVQDSAGNTVSAILASGSVRANRFETTSDSFVAISQLAADTPCGVRIGRGDGTVGLWFGDGTNWWSNPTGFQWHSAGTLRLARAANQTGDVGLVLSVRTSTTSYEPTGGIEAQWADSTHASRKGRLVLRAHDTAVRECMRLEASGSAPMLGFFGAPAVVRPSVGPAATDAASTQALANSLRAALISLGLVS